MKKLFVFAVAAVAMAACSSNDEGTAKVNQNEKIELTTGVAQTRATSQTLQATQIANGQYVLINFESSVAPNRTDASTTAAAGSGLWNTTNSKASAVYVANGSGNLSIPTGSAASPVKWPVITSTSPTLILGASSVDIEAWAPVAAADIAAPTAFSVQADQTTEANYIASDYIYGKKTGVTEADVASPVQVKFDHMLTKINVNLKALDPSITLDGATVEFCPAGTDLYLDGDISAADGSVTVNTTGATSKVVMTSFMEAAHTCSAIIIPQTITASAAAPVKLFEVTLAGSTKKYELTIPKVFAAGKEYTYNITISDGQTLVLSEQINNWTEGGPDSVIAN